MKLNYAPSVHKILHFSDFAKDLTKQMTQILEKKSIFEHSSKK